MAERCRYISDAGSQCILAPHAERVPHACPAKRSVLDVVPITEYDAAQALAQLCTALGVTPGLTLQPIDVIRLATQRVEVGSPHIRPGATLEPGSPEPLERLQFALTHAEYQLERTPPGPRISLEREDVEWLARAAAYVIATSSRLSFAQSVVQEAPSDG